jgi:NADPH:quinone reductase-like Zn-dependent oxidoreductase
VSRFAKGDRVVTLFNQGHLGGPLDPKVLGTGTGGLLDGALTEFGVFDENALVEMPRTLTWEEASTLSCAALTAWNALYGLDGKSLKPGDVVLTQGTGGVSLFALQVCIQTWHSEAHCLLKTIRSLPLQRVPL